MTMKTRKILSLLLCLLLAMSMFLVACNKQKQDGGSGSNTSSDSEKQAIIDDIASINLGTIIDAVMNNSSTTLGDLFSGINCEGNVNINLGNQNMNVYTGMKNGMFKMSFTDTNTDDAYMFVRDNEAIILTSSDGGYIVNAGSAQEATDMIDGLVTDKMINILKNFKLPAISKSQLTKEGDAYIVATSYYEAVAKSIIDTATDLMIEAGMPASAAPSEEYYNALIAQVTQIIDTLGIKLGFTVSNNRISGVVFGLDTTAGKIAGLTGEEVYDTDDNGAIKASFKVGFIPDSLVVTSISADVSATVDDQTASIKANITTKLNSNNQPIGLDATVNMSGTVADYFDQIYIGENEYSDDEYAYVYLTGTAAVTAEAHVDLSKLSSDSKANVALATVKAEQTFTGYRVEVFNNETYEYETVDPSQFEIECTPSEHNGTVEISASVDNTGKNALEFTVSFKQGGVSVAYTGNATYNTEAATGFGEIPAAVESITSDKDFVEKYTALSQMADEMHDKLYFYNVEGPSGEYAWAVTYLYHDTETGLYVLFDGPESNPEIRTNTPNNEYYDYYEITIDPSTGEIVILEK